MKEDFKYLVSDDVYQLRKPNLENYMSEAIQRSLSSESSFMSYESLVNTTSNEQEVERHHKQRLIFARKLVSKRKTTLNESGSKQSTKFELFEKISRDGEDYFQTKYARNKQKHIEKQKEQFQQDQISQKFINKFKTTKEEVVTESSDYNTLIKEYESGILDKCGKNQYFDGKNIICSHRNPELAESVILNERRRSKLKEIVFLMKKNSKHQ